MKKKWYFLLIAVMLTISGFSQTLNEGFEGTTFPPDDWNNVHVSGANSWQKSTGDKHSGNASVCASWASAGHENWLITPKLTVSSTTDSIVFWLYTDSYYSGTTLNVKVSTTDNQVSSFSSTALMATSSFEEDWTRCAVDLSSYNGQNIYVGFQIIDNNGCSVYIDDITGPTIFVPSCPKPKNLVATNPTTTSFDLGWTDSGSMWNIDYKLESDTTWTSLTNISTNPYTIPSLTSSSAYQVRVQRVCSPSDVSDWSNVLTTRTACDVITTLPWHEYFNETWVENLGISNRAAPPCWLNLDGGTSVDSYGDNGNYYWKRGEDESHDTIGGDAAIHTDFAVVAHNDWLITPQLALTGNQRVIFWAQRGSAVTTEEDEISVWITDSTIDSTGLAGGDSLPGFHQLMQTIIPQGAWTRYELPLSAYPAGTYRLAFVRRNTPYDGYYLNLDDITVEDIPACPEVFGTTLTSTSTTSMKVNFNTNNGNGSGWNIAYDTVSAFDPAVCTNVIAVADVSALPYTIQGLIPGATYHVAVQQNCGGAWSTPETLKLQTTSVTVPYTQTFTDSSSITEYTYINSDTVNVWHIGTAVDADSNSTTKGAMYITNDNGLTNSATFLTSYGLAHRNIAMLNVNFTTANQFNVDFDYRDKGGILNVYLTDADYIPSATVTPTANDNIILLGTYTGSTQWEHAIIPLNGSYSNTFKKIIFFWNDTYSWGTTPMQPPAAIDNLAINTVACGMQTNLTLVSKDTTKATISWHDANNAGSYLIAYSTDSVWNYQTTTDTLYTITGLIPGVSYNVKVAALCSANDTSLFTNIINFYTECSYEDIPYLEDFATNVKSSPCWMFREGTLATATTFSTGTTSYWNYKSTPKSMGVNIYGTSRNEWMITPSINLGTDGNTYQLEFDASLKKYSYNDDGGAPDVAATDDKFAVVISRDNGLTWSNANAYVWTSDGSTTRNYHAFGVNPTHVIIPLYDSTASAPINGNIKIGFYGESTVDNDDNNLYIDNVAVNPWSECQKPTSLAISNITTTSAKLSFTENGSATSWEYAISDDSTMNPSTATNILTSTTNPIDITSLNPATQYYVALRSVCTSSNAEWSPIISFKTIANPATLPYLCDFEDATENPNWIFVQDGQVNKWYIGTDTANSVNNTANGANGLYVSNDGGSSYTYSMSTGGANGTICYAFRDFIVPPNATQLALSFDWKAKGYNATEDFLRFFVVNPDSTTITAGQVLSGNLDNDAQIGNINGGGQHWLSQQTTWQHKNFIIDVAQYPFMVPGDTIRLLIQWRVVSSYGSTQPPAAVDNISLSALTCPSPSALTVNSNSSTELTATWTGTASNYEVTCVNGGIIQRFYTANSTCTINNLTPATAYTITVKAICGVGDTSFATNPVVGITACLNGAISSFPWIESFEGGLNCWNQEYITGTTDWNTTNTHYTATDGTHYADFYSTEEGDQTRLVSPTLNITTLSSPYLKFKHAQEDWYGDQDTLGVYYKADASSNWTYLTSFSSSITDWQTDSVALPNGSATYQIAFFGHSEYGHGVAIDEVQVYNNGEVILTEPTVATIAATNVNATTATLNGTITAGTNPITAIGFEYRPTTSTTYTNIAASSNGTASANVSNLTNNTQYTFRCYATTSVGTVYGDTMTFTTLNQQIVVLPSVTTDSSNAISASTAKLYATITTIGTEPITQQGFMVKAVNDAEFTTNSGSVVNNQMTTTLVNLLPATTYTYKAFVSTADTTIYGVEKTFTTVSGIADVENNSFVVSLYPNPTQGDAILNVEGLNENANVIITDIQGRLVSNQAMKAGQKTLTINRNNLTSGVYYVRVVTSSATRTQKLIIK